jgi:hypothetical protein
LAPTHAAPDTPSPYSVQCTLKFDTKEHFEEALKAKAEKVLGGVHRFSNKPSLILVGETVGST